MTKSSDSALGQACRGEGLIAKVLLDGSPQRNILRLEVGVGVVVERARREPPPERPQVSAHLLDVERGQLGRLLVEVASDLRIRVEAPPQLRVELQPPESLR